jgi:hypothetical protein
MQVQVENGLASLGARVGHDSESVPYPLLASNLRGHPHEVTEQVRIGNGSLPDGFHGPLGNDKDMNRRFGIDVTKRQGLVVLVDNVRRDLAPDDSIEDCVSQSGFNLCC